MLLIIDNYDSFTYNLYQLIAEQIPDEEVLVKRNDALSVEEVEALNPSAIVLSPGPSRPEKAGICIELVEKLSPTVPMLGVCLGLQAMAIAFGGKVVLAKEVVHGKTSLAFHQQHGLFEGIPLPCTVGRYHSLIVERQGLPATMAIEADTPDGEIMAARHVEYPCFGVQFHPESVLTPEGARMIENFLKMRNSCAK